jgi:hypothetical protein
VARLVLSRKKVNLVCTCRADAWKSKLAVNKTLSVDVLVTADTISPHVEYVVAVLGKVKAALAEVEYATQGKASTTGKQPSKTIEASKNMRVIKETNRHG